VPSPSATRSPVATSPACPGCMGRIGSPLRLAYHLAARVLVTDRPPLTFDSSPWPTTPGPLDRARVAPASARRHPPQAVASPADDRALAAVFPGVVRRSIAQPDRILVPTTRRGEAAERPGPPAASGPRRSSPSSESWGAGSTSSAHRWNTSGYRGRTSSPPTSRSLRRPGPPRRHVRCASGAPATRGRQCQLICEQTCGVYKSHRLLLALLANALQTSRT